MVVFFAGCSARKKAMITELKNDTPISQSLYDSIVKLDSIFFNAYNTCDLTTQAFFYSDSIEFYHDKTGLTTSKQDLLEATRKNICGKVTRELVKGSIEVYPIANFGAVEIALHRFHNLIEGSVSNPAKFIILWQKKNNEWKIRQVVSLH